MNHIDTLLLVALPASGKSEIRRYLAHVGPDVAARDFRLGPTVQLDDYPYVMLMRLMDGESRAAGGPVFFFDPDSEELVERRDWGTLARLLAEDYSQLGRTAEPAAGSPTRHLLDRIDRARNAVGARPATDVLTGPIIDRLVSVLDAEIGAWLNRLRAELERYDETSTVIVEFARGGPAGARLPLPAPHGYAYTLANLGPEMLARASIMYVWVTPEESRRRNRERGGPGPEEQASILHHRVPDTVMHADYGTEDMLWLIETGGGEVVVPGNGAARRLPAVVFDNRDDYTTFLRSDPAEWSPTDVDAIHSKLKQALSALADGTL